MVLVAVRSASARHRRIDGAILRPLDVPGLDTDRRARRDEPVIAGLVNARLKAHLDAFFERYPIRGIQPDAVCARQRPSLFPAPQSARPLRVEHRQRPARERNPAPGAFHVCDLEELSALLAQVEAGIHDFDPLLGGKGELIVLVHLFHVELEAVDVLDRRDDRAVLARPLERRRAAISASMDFHPIELVLQSLEARRRRQHTRRV